MLLADKPLVEVLHEVCRLAAASLPEADEVSITLVEDDRTRTAAFTGSLAATLDERQYEAGFGPCLDAAQSGGVLRVQDTAAEDLYPAFAAVARRQGVTSVLALGLPMPTQVLGGLNLYRLHGTEPFSAETEAAAAQFGTYAAVALANAALLASRERLATHLQTAMASRSVIDQAKGIVMSIAACDADEAFRLLAKQSQHANRKLRDIAAEVVAAAERGERAWGR
ncbi:GAF and ANTAR domain-containing protein [Kineosporiaceae bacterium B12]|nr:GAF and ANTAR domain-containing protein [Kineococcus rubinsiae]